MSEEMEKITVDYEAPQERIQYESERLVRQIKEQLVGQEVAYLHRLAQKLSKNQFRNCNKPFKQGNLAMKI